MEDSSKSESDIVALVSSLNERLTALEAKVTKLSSTHEQGRGGREVIRSIKLLMFPLIVPFQQPRCFPKKSGVIFVAKTMFAGLSTFGKHG